MKYVASGMIAGFIVDVVTRADAIFVKSAPVKLAPETLQSVIVAFARYALVSTTFGPTKYIALL